MKLAFVVIFWFLYKATAINKFPTQYARIFTKDQMRKEYTGGVVKKNRHEGKV